MINVKKLVEDNKLFLSLRGDITEDSRPVFEEILSRNRIQMKNLIVVLSVALLSVSMNVNAQEKPVAKKECSTAEKAACAKDKKACATATTATAEKKSCDTSKKAGCCAKKA